MVVPRIDVVSRKGIVAFLLVGLFFPLFAQENPDQIKLWKINYEPAYGLPPAALWQITYPSETLRMDNLGVPVLGARNDLDAKHPYSFINWKGEITPETFSGRLIADLRIRAVDFGTRGFFFMLLMRIPASDGTIVPVILRIGREKLFTSAGSVSLPEPLGTDVYRFSLIADLGTRQLDLFLDGKKIFTGTIQLEEKPQKQQISFGDGSVTVGGAFQLYGLRVTTLPPIGKSGAEAE